ncbi:MAG: TAXI family TRAP transporter solute-binding subunit [Butyricicoccus sp.]|nr:TAXI family TRAP transporter solute-binding subunit [Butyricicoccus sp.]
MKKFLAAVAAFALIATSLVGCGGGSSAEGPQSLTLATGGDSGTYYAVGGVLGTTLSPKLEKSTVAAVTSGASKANIQMIDMEEAQLAIVQNDVMTYAINGTDLFEGEKYDSFSAVASVYAETCQIVAVDSITSVEDLKGKTVSVGDAGSGTEFNARQILEAYGITFDDINVVNLGFGDSANAIKDGKIDAAFVTAGHPTTAVVELCTTVDINVLPIDDAHAQTLISAYPYYTQVTIPGGTYSSVEEDVTTVAVMATLIASNELSEDVVYELLKAMDENLDSLRSGHAKFEEFSIESAANGVSIDFHPGAQKYLEEKGVL